MCGIVGLFAKTPELEGRLGAHLAAMLTQLDERGPDSAGVAVYRDPTPVGWSKLTLYSPNPAEDWERVARDVAAAAGEAEVERTRALHAVLLAAADAAAVEEWLAAAWPHVRVTSRGRAIEIYKDVGHPRELVARFGLAGLDGTHGLGHTRMATESRVTTAAAQPFSSGFDVCLVHNGSLSNHNTLRRRLRREGVEFLTENDSEVAAGYLGGLLREGAGLEQALDGCIGVLDGFYTFLVGTADGFAVLRDPIACKPAVMAETDDWVAVASEYRSLAVLPGAAEARIWEPEPGVVYAWERALV